MTDLDKFKEWLDNCLEVFVVIRFCPQKESERFNLTPEETLEYLDQLVEEGRATKKYAMVCYDCEYEGTDIVCFSEDPDIKYQCKNCGKKYDGSEKDPDLFVIIDGHNRDRIDGRSSKSN